MPFVLDNSVVTGWYLPDQASSYSQAIATRDAQLKEAAMAAGVAIF